jgi:hypothetical protein
MPIAQQAGARFPGLRLGQGCPCHHGRVALAANNCWFKSKDSAFRPYHLAPELNSYSGRPRILVVPAGNPGGRPLLVVHAEGNPAKVEAFGPLMGHSTGNRIASDVQRWASGQPSCTARG